MSPEPQGHIGKTPLRLGAFLTIGGDLAVARIGLGAMRLCGPGIWGRPRDPEAARMVLRRAIGLGVTLIVFRGEAKSQDATSVKYFTHLGHFSPLKSA
jgi:hypothetical protein